MNTKEGQPIHLMIKPEGLESFPGYTNTQLDLFEAITDAQRVVDIVTTLTPEEVSIIYPGDIAPQNYKDYLATHETKQVVFLGREGIHDKGQELKGKMSPPAGVRGTLNQICEEFGFTLEDYQNFIHSTDNTLETYKICQHFNTEKNGCEICAAKSLCQSQKK
jgi:hypothetical protein